MDRPTVGSIVHYYGYDGGSMTCRASVVTKVVSVDTDNRVALAIFGQDGMSFKPNVCNSPFAASNAYTWHWPERVD